MKSGLFCLFIFTCSFLFTQEKTGSLNPIDSTKTSSVPLSKSAVESTVFYDASDSIEIDNVNRVIFLFGDAVVTYEDIKLEAPFIEICMNKNELFAYGENDSTGKYIKPVFTDPNSTFQAKEIHYNFETKKGKINQVLTEESGGYLHGEKVKKMGDNTIFVRHGKYTTCNAEHPHFHLQCSKLKVIPQEKIISGPAYLVVQDIPTPIVLPFALFPNTDKRASGVIMPTFGGNNPIFGFSLQRGGYFWAINDYMNLELLGDIYTKGSYGIHAMSNYRKRYKYNGNWGLDYLRWISGDSKIPSEYSSRFDFKIRWRHSQDPKARPNGTFSASVNFGTAGYNQNDLTTQMTNERLQASTNSNVTYSFKLPKSPFTGSIAASQQQNNITGDMTFTLPNFRFSMNRIYLRNPDKLVGKPKWYQNFNMTYAMTGKGVTVGNDSLLTLETIDQFLGPVQKGIKHSIPIQGSIKTKYFNITPSATFNSFWYFDYKERESVHDDYTEYQGFKVGNDFRTSLSFQTVLYGDFVPIGKRKRIEKIRHVLTPNIGFTYTPDFANEQWQQFSGYRSAYDTLGNQSNYNIFTGNIVGNPSRGKSGSINFTLKNTIQMKVKTPKDTVNATKKVSIFDNLTIRTDYNFFADSLNLNIISVSGNAKIIDGLSLNMSARFDPYQLNSEFSRINQFMASDGKLARLIQANVGTGYRFEGKKDRENQGQLFKRLFREDYQYYLDHPDMFIDFNIPWSLNIRYNMNFREQVQNSELVLDLTQTLNFSGTLRVTEGWVLDYASGYDFVNKDVTSNTRLGINRNLHCWEMSLEWVPFGRNANYLFTINAKSSMLQDLKLNRRKTSREYGEL